MATEAEKRLWKEEKHQEYCNWVESLNAANRANARLHGGHALITDPDTGRQKMEGLRPGQIVSFDITDGPRSQRGKRYFYGPDWNGPFPQFSIVETLSGGLPRTPRECLEAIFDFKTEAQSVAGGVGPQRNRPGTLQRLRAALRSSPQR